MMNIIVGESVGKLLSKVHLSNNSGRIYHMTEDINDQLIEKNQRKDIGLQLDEATYNNKNTHLIYSVRFIDCDDVVDLHFCKNITASAKT